MRWITLFFLVFGLLITACTPVTQPQGTIHLSQVTATPIQPTVTQTRSPTVAQITNTPTLHPSPSPTLTPSLTPEVHSPTPVMKSTQTVITVEVTSLCPAERTVPLNALGLNPNTRLVLQQEGPGLHKEIETSYWLLNPTEAEPRYISSLALGDGMVNINFETSPDGRWVLFERREIVGERQMVWVSSLDGAQQWPVKEIGKYAHAEWASEYEIVIIGLRDENWPWPESPPGYLYTPLMSINPFTGKELPLAPLPEPADALKRHWLQYYFHANGHAYALYTEPSESSFNFQLYQYKNNITQPVFQWIETIVKPFSLRIYLLADDTFVITFEDDDGIDISPKLDLDDISASIGYEGVMRKVIFPDQYWPLYVRAISAYGDVLVLETFSEELFVDESLYTLDTEDMVLKDYCLSTDIGTELSLSPDERFAAFTYYENPGSHSGFPWIIVLNLETGYLTRIDGYQMIGWGIMDD